MGKPRIRFREFLLLMTLASLLSATWAIRARMSYRETAQRHTMSAIRIRANKYFWQGQIDRARWREEVAATWVEKVEAQARLREVRAAEAKAMDEAEHHEYLARRYEQ